MALWHKKEVMGILDGSYPDKELSEIEENNKKTQHIIDNLINGQTKITNTFVVQECPADFKWDKWEELEGKIKRLRQQLQENNQKYRNVIEFFCLLVETIKNGFSIFPADFQEKFRSLHYD